MSLESYFRRNAIVEKALEERTPEQKKAGRLVNDSAFYNNYYATNLEEFKDCVDFKSNSVVFDIALDAIVRFEDIFEPCCGSGIFGCYIAQNVAGKYIGIDRHPKAIEKAKKRAAQNGLSREIFAEGDILDYKGFHEAIVGRDFAQDVHFNINYKMLDALSRISKNIIVVQNAEFGRLSSSIEAYKRAFSKLGYSFDVLTDRRLFSTATGAEVFVFEAHKKDAAYFIPTVPKPLPRQSEACPG
jgi:predicted RNA methylase